MKDLKIESKSVNCVFESDILPIPEDRQNFNGSPKQNACTPIVSNLNSTVIPHETNCDQFAQCNRSSVINDTFTCPEHQSNCCATACDDNQTYSNAPIQCDNSIIDSQVLPKYSNKNSPNRIKLLTSYNPKVTKTISAFRKKRGKYYLAGKIGNNEVVCFADSAADISITDHVTSRLGKIEKLSTPMKIRSFDNGSTQTITETSTLRLHFGSVVAIMKFFVCKTEYTIIGIDIFRNSRLNVSLNTKTEILWIDKYPLKTACSPEEAIKELHSRMNEGKCRKEKKINDRRPNWVRSKVKQNVKPYSVADIEVVTDYDLNRKEKYVFLSMFDDEQETNELYIPSMMMYESNGHFLVTIENKSGNEVCFGKGTPVGEIKRCADKANRFTVMAYDGDQLKETIRSMKNLTCSEISTLAEGAEISHSGVDRTESGQPKILSENLQKPISLDPRRGEQKQAPNMTREDTTDNIQPSKINFDQKSGTPELCKLGEIQKSAITPEPTDQNTILNRIPKQKKQTNIPIQLSKGSNNFENTQKLESPINTQNDPNSDGKPVNFSELVDINKVDNEKFQKCLKDGIAIDLDFSTPEPDIGIDDTPVDIGKERKRSEGCDFWPDRAEYLKMFDMSAVDDELKNEVSDLLWSFRHIMMNESRPDMFHRGVEMAPIKINLQKNSAPFPRIPPRRMNATKLRHLKEHLKVMLERGIIEELHDTSDAFISPVGIVVEHRWIASEKRMKEKSRLRHDLLGYF